MRFIAIFALAAVAGASTLRAVLAALPPVGAAWTLPVFSLYLRGVSVTVGAPVAVPAEDVRAFRVEVFPRHAWTSESGLRWIVATEHPSRATRSAARELPR